MMPDLDLASPEAPETQDVEVTPEMVEAGMHMMLTVDLATVDLAEIRAALVQAFCEMVRQDRLGFGRRSR